MSIHKKNRTSGASLIELIIAISVMAIALSAMMGMFRTSAAHSADSMPRLQAAMLAEGLMEEVLSKNFSKPQGGYAGPFAAANRSMFDTVTDYSGVAIPGSAALSGASYPALSAYTATVSVSPAALGVVPSSQIYAVTITVSGPGGLSYSLSGYKVNYG